MEGQTVFIVFEWRDYRKENGASILSVHLNKETALEAMEKAILEFSSENDDRDIERFEDGANVTDGCDCEVFEVVEQKIKA